MGVVDTVRAFNTIQLLLGGQYPSHSSLNQPKLPLNLIHARKLVSFQVLDLFEKYGHDLSPTMTQEPLTPNSTLLCILVYDIFIF